MLSCLLAPGRRSAPIAAALCAAALAACSDAATEPAGLRPSETPAQNLTPVAATSVATCAGGTMLLTADEARTFALHNQERARLALPSLCLSPVLTTAARAHSADMLAKGYFAHTAPTGETFAQRVVRFGYTPFRLVAENIALATGLMGNPEYTFNRWLASDGHRRNIHNGQLREIGIGVVAGTWKTWANTRVYTADFGTR